MGGEIISELGGGIIPLRGAQSSRNWGAASSAISTQGGQARGVILVFRRLPLHQPGEEVADALGREEAIGEPIRHQSIKLVHRDRAALAGALAQGAQVEQV